MQKECKVHGLTEYVIEGSGYSRCKKCRVKNITNTRRRTKEKLVKHFGGKCTICGYDKCMDALEFHHTNPEDKLFSISFAGSTQSFAAKLEEAKKCILVCANCHRELEFHRL